MIFLTFLGNFFAGAFLSNCIPHLAAGLRGEPFPTPFAKPPGEGLSSPTTNALWGSLNFFLGWGCLHAAPVEFGLNVSFLLFVAGFVALAIFTASHFGKVRAKRN
jgi:hypothetical protein